jgi:hypothetical protein
VTSASVKNVSWFAFNSNSPTSSADITVHDEASASRTLASAGQSTHRRLDAVGPVGRQVVDHQRLDAVLRGLEDRLLAEFVGADQRRQIIQLGDEVGERLALRRGLLDPSPGSPIPNA